jgi:hypothetical protein
MEDEKFLKLQIQRFEQKIFALALWLIGGDKNKRIISPLPALSKRCAHSLSMKQRMFF